MTTIETKALDVKVGDRFNHPERGLMEVGTARPIKRGKAKGKILIMLSVIGGHGGCVLGEFDPSETLPICR